jgi:hypothetical protein
LSPERAPQIVPSGTARVGPPGAGANAIVGAGGFANDAGRLDVRDRDRRFADHEPLLDRRRWHERRPVDADLGLARRRDSS